MNQLIAERFLVRMGCKAKSVSNGVEALDFLRREPFDVVLMDCMMPVMDGFETTRRIRSGETGCSKQPVVALTANAMVEDVARCSEAGMDGHLAKPLNGRQLQAVLARWMPAKGAKP